MNKQQSNRYASSASDAITELLNALKAVDREDIRRMGGSNAQCECCVIPEP